MLFRSEGRRRWWTTRLDRKQGHDLPRFRALREGKTPTPACLIVFPTRCFRLQGLRHRLDLAQRCLGFNVCGLQLPPAPYIGDRVSGERTRLGLVPSRYLFLAVQTKFSLLGLRLVLNNGPLDLPFLLNVRTPKREYMHV